ncbi:MFS general substrate transporter [Tricholoma matsutake]|nr:MFS general substrate transporter [Tricholoma matsutake 945]
MTQVQRPKTGVSIASSATDVQPEKVASAHVDQGDREPAVPHLEKVDTVQDSEFDWETDPENPRNWTSPKKWTAVSIVSLYTFVPPLASSMMAPGLPEIATKYGITSQTTVAMTLSIFLLSFAIGPLFLAPLSEMYGRTWVLHICNLFSTGFSLGCAFAPTTSSFIGLRFLSGFTGSAPIAIGGGSVGDCFAARDRASAMAIYSLGPLIGPVIGPIAGGFIAQSVGIKYVFVVIACVSGVASIIGIPLLRETYAPIIRLRKAKRSADPEKLAQLLASSNAQENKLHYLWVNLSRPLAMLFRSFICFVLSLYMAFLYGIYYLMFATFADFFSSTYGFSPGIGGLCYLGLGIGFLLATYTGAKFSDQVYKYLADKNEGKGKPEMRMPALFFGSFFVPIGLFWFGWSAQAKIHWIMPIIGTGIFGFGLMTCYLPIQLYLVDAFVYAASAVSAASVFRSMMGFIFPLFGRQMYSALGEGGGNSLLAGLAIILGIPFPVWIYYRGESIRLNSKVKL